jgi:hypothetical protein
MATAPDGMVEVVEDDRDGDGARIVALTAAGDGRAAVIVAHALTAVIAAHALTAAGSERAPRS